MQSAPIAFVASVTGTSDSHVSWSVLNGTQSLPSLISATGELKSITDCSLLGERLIVQAISNSSPAAVGTASVSLQISPVNPATITVPTSETLIFSTTDLPCGENSSDLPPSGYQWSLTDGAAGGTIGKGGLAGAFVPSAFANYTAPAVTGTYQLNVTLRESTRRAMITVVDPVPYTGALQLCRSGHTATLLATGAVLLVGEGGEYLGGACGAPPPAPPSAIPAATAELFDPVAGTFALTALPIYATKHAHAATLLQDGRVLLTGGLNASGVSSAHAEIYDSATGLYTATADMTHGHRFHAAAMLADGRVVIAGDYPVGAPLEIYDPTSGSFTALTNGGSCCEPFATATLLHSGQMLIAGGGLGGGDSTAYLLDANAQSLVQTGSLNRGRLGHTATLLSNGKVLIVGGVEQAYLFQTMGAAISQTAELYDPATGTFTVTSGPMLAPRALHSAALLPDGRVIIVGGLSQAWAQFDQFDSQHALQFYQSAIATNTTEIYDPATDRFTAGPVIPARLSPTATTLLNGQVLIAGGGPLPAELYK